MTEKQLYCTLVSEQFGEQLFGTCNRVDVWFLLEHNRPWGVKAFEESNLQEPIKAWFSNHLRTIPNARLHFIKRGSRAPDSSFYIALARESDPVLYKFRFETYDDLLNIDVNSLLSGDVTENRSDERLFIVCTNGKRDRCCSLYGLPFYSALGKIGGDSVWQTTHTGGHRFSATILCLPHGIGYGRLGNSDAANVYESYLDDRLINDKFRGRSCYSDAVQAAEYYVRAHTGSDNINDFRLLSADESDQSNIVVEFAQESTGEQHRITLHQHLSEWESFHSCAADKLERSLEHDLKSITSQVLVS